MHPTELATLTVTTLKDLSRHLGISITQVSRALNDYSDVSQQTKERVREAAKELGYSANLTARSLATGRTGMVALIRTGDIRMPRDTSVFEMICGLSEEFYKRELQFVLHMTPRDVDPINAYKKALANGSFDGFVILEPRLNDERIQLLERSDAAFVVHGRTGGDPKHAYYDIGNFEVGLQHVRHLTAQGHQRIAFLNGREESTYSEDRLQGYIQGLKEAGIDYDPCLVSSGSMTENRGLVSTVELFKILPERPTALICGNVMLAKGAYTSLSAMGFSIPRDVSVSAHDDVLTDVRASAFCPPLTVTRSPFNKSYPALAELLYCQINQDNSKPNQLLAQSEFIDRASTNSYIAP